MEKFQTFSESGEVMTLEERGVVHSKGLWHQSAQVYLFNEHGDLLIQQRSDQKDLYAGLWDGSVGEHLRPRESFRDGALRGLYEELQVEGFDIHEFGETVRSDFSYGELTDREFKQAFFGIFRGMVRPDPIEVQSISWVGKRDFIKLTNYSRQAFCPPFLMDIVRLDLLNRWDKIVDWLIEV